MIFAVLFYIEGIIYYNIPLEECSCGFGQGGDKNYFFITLPVDRV
jgi:hypothetical protein